MVFFHSWSSCSAGSTGCARRLVVAAQRGRSCRAGGSPCDRRPEVEAQQLTVIVQEADAAKREALDLVEAQPIWQPGLVRRLSGSQSRTSTPSMGTSSRRRAALIRGL